MRHQKLEASSDVAVRGKPTNPEQPYLSGLAALSWTRAQLQQPRASADRRIPHINLPRDPAPQFPPSTPPQTHHKMVAMYTIAGRQVGSHWVTIPPLQPQTPHPLTPILHQQLAIATLSTVFGGAFAFAKSGPAKATTTPPINASSKDEEQFIQYVTLRTAPHATSSGGS